MFGSYVGRRRELALVHDALDQALRHQSSVVLVTGDAGIGKSRFTREVAAQARAREFEVVWSAGWPAGGAPAYWPWPQVLAALDPSARDALDIGPIEPESQRFEQFRLATTVLSRRAAERPLVVVLDDSHTMDIDGLLLTRFVALGSEGMRLLLVLTQRAGADVAPPAAELLDEIARVAIGCRLDGLAPDEVSALIDARGGDTDALVVQRVCELTGGNPFLIEQVLEAGLHLRAGPAPDPVRRLAEARLVALDPLDRNVVEAAAVLGTPLVPSELSSVSAADNAVVQRACQRAATVGLLRADETRGFVFPHELAREAILASVAPTRLAQLHGRCVALLDGGRTSPERAGRRARHALAWATYSPAHTGEAVAVARQSARVLRAQGAPEAAAELLQSALALSEPGGAGPATPLLVDLGEALLATGRLRASRDVFRRAITDVAQAGDPQTLARATLGLGGVWVYEHRTAASWRAYIDAVERAIEHLASDPSPDAAALLASLRLRQSAERAAVGQAEPVDVMACVEDVRATGSAGSLIAGLSLLHHMMMGPQYAHERVTVAEELIERARAAGDDLHLVIGLLWGAVDDVLLGRDARRAVGELRARADALGMRAILFVTDAIDVMWLIRSGELATAESAAAACHERGVEVGDADAETYFAAHLLAVHWYRGTAAALLPFAQAMAASSDTPANNPVFTAAAAALAGEAGDTDAAEQALSVFRDSTLERLLLSSTGLVTLFAVVEAASRIGDAELAGQAYEALRPFEDLPTMGAIGVCCFGSTARTLGIAARTTGRIDDAVVHLERAIIDNQRLGNRPMTAISRADLAETLMARRSPGDRVRASQLMARAIDAGEMFGLTARLEVWRLLQRRVDDDAPDGSRATVHRLDGSWILTDGDACARVAPTAGMQYLAALLASPRTDVPVGKLAGIEVTSTPQTLLDATALHDLRDRIAELESAIDAAWSRDDTRRAGDLQHELDDLVAHLRRAVGRNGRSRRFDDATERARTSVQKAIRRALAAIALESPELGDKLARSVKTGYCCRYDPVNDAPERWDVQMR